MKKIFGAFCLILLGACVASAHFLWINPQMYHLSKGSPLRLTLGFGHHFPGAGGDFLEASRVKGVFLLTPKGEKIKLSPRSYPIIFETPSVLSEEGTYLLVAEKKAGFFTKTVAGFYRQPKTGLEDVIECKFSKRVAKALLTVGKPGGEVFKRALGQELEIIPLKDPATLKPGERLPLRVLYQGRPYAKALVLATYEGFSPSDQPSFALATRTNSQGEVSLRLDRHGVWLVLVSYQRPYPKKEVCDVETVVSTLTFELP